MRLQSQTPGHEKGEIQSELPQSKERSNQNVLPYKHKQQITPLELPSFPLQLRVCDPRYRIPIGAQNEIEVKSMPA